jgi:hypothetical protein
LEEKEMEDMDPMIMGDNQINCGCVKVEREVINEEFGEQIMVDDVRRVTVLNQATVLVSVRSNQDISKPVHNCNLSCLSYNDGGRNLWCRTNRVVEYYGWNPNMINEITSRVKIQNGKSKVKMKMWLWKIRIYWKKWKTLMDGVKRDGELAVYVGDENQKISMESQWINDVKVLGRNEGKVDNHIALEESGWNGTGIVRAEVETAVKEFVQQIMVDDVRRGTVLYQNQATVVVSVRSSQGSIRPDSSCCSNCLSISCGDVGERIQGRERSSRERNVMSHAELRILSGIEESVKKRKERDKETTWLFELGIYWNRFAYRKKWGSWMLEKFSVI